jgi:superfamily II DNA or RNA helicase
MKTIQGYTPFNFQSDTINKMIEIININNGGCIFDETGLGKTITSIVVAATISNNITIICGKANKVSWDKITKLYKDVYPEMNFLVTTANSLNKFTDNESDFVIVDEAHNFRNRKNKTFIDLFKFIQKNNAKVLLLTATPFNNRFSELIGMFSLINFSNDSLPFYALGGILNEIIEVEKDISIMDRFDLKMKSFQHIGQYVENEHKIKHLVHELNLIISTFSIRNTRDYIKNTYPLDVKQMGMFPIIENTDIDIQNYKYNMDLYSRVDKTNKILKSLPLVKQNIINYLSLKNNKNINEHYDFAGLFKTLLYKRMDSSIHSFVCTINNSIENLRIALDNIDVVNNKITIKLKEYSLKIHANELTELIDKDIVGFTSILEIWDGFSETAKFDTLFNLINKDKKNKTIVFTEYNDTLDKLVSIAKERKIKYLIYSNKSNEKDLDTILTEFDANYEKEFQTDKYNVLFCTDILSEGQNLHRANTVIHFDSKWNPARMIQRNGRVDRITINSNELKTVNVYRFGSNNIIDEIIKLEEKIDTKTNKSNEFLNFINVTNELPRFNNFESNSTFGYYSDNILPKIGYVIRNKQYDFCVTNNDILYGQNFKVTSCNKVNKLKYLGKLIDGASVDKFKFRVRNNYVSIFRSELVKKHGYQYKDNSFLYLTNPLYNNTFTSILTDIKNSTFDENIEWMFNILNKKNNHIDSCILILSKTGILYEGQELSK